MRKTLWVFLAISALLLSGCGSNDFDFQGSDGNETNATIPGDNDGTGDGSDINTSEGLKLELPIKKIVISETNKTKKIVVRVTEGAFGAKGKSVIIKSDLDASVGSFTPKEAVSDSAGDATFVYASPATLVDKKGTVTFCLKEDSSLCSTLEVSLSKDNDDSETTIDNINYSIVFNLDNGANNLALGSRESATVKLVDKDTSETIPADRIEGVTITSRDATVLKITPEGGGKPVSTISYTAKHNPVKVLLTADKANSGLAILEVIIKYTNKNGVEKIRAQLFAVAVLSGNPTAFSINSDGVSYNFGTKQFEHKFIIQAIDNNGNPISSPGVITASVMASFALDSNGNEILYGRYAKKNRGVSATLTPDGGKAKIELNGAATFSAYDNGTERGIKKHRAMVAVFGNVETYEANGKWSLKDILSSNVLSLSNEYHGGAFDGLGMAIGYNYRDKFCTSTYEEAVVYVDSVDGKYTLDQDGKAVVVVKHDAYMIGKRIMLMVNMTALDPSSEEVLRSGEVHETTLKFVKYLKGDTVTIEKGEVRFARIPGIIDTGSPDEYFLRTATFGCEYKLNNAKIVSGPSRNDPKSCAGTYFGYTVTTVDSNKTGSITFGKCQVDNEPAF